MRTLLLRSLFSPLATLPAPPPADAALEELGRALGQGARRLFGRSLAIREVDAGSCNGCELKIHALNNPIYDIERFGIRFVASPRHADVLLVTGPVTRNMKVALERTYAATPDPKWVVAVGDCGCGCGVFEGSYAVVGGRQDHPGRSAHPRLSAHADGAAPRPDRAGGQSLGRAARLGRFLLQHIR